MSTGAPTLPGGTVTFLVADILDWSVLVRELGDAMADVIDDFERLFRDAAEAEGGHAFESSGDALFAAFTSATRGVAAAADLQRQASAHRWPQGAEILIQIGLHTGEPTVGRGRYLGLAVHRAGRAADAAHGGQILLTSATRSLIERLPHGIALRDLGYHGLPDFDEAERLFQLVVEGLPDEFPPPRIAADTTAEDAAALPSGTLTLLFTDIESSTQHLRRLRERWGEVRAEHRRILRAAVAEAGGSEVDTQGDSFFFVFARARDALAAATSAQLRLFEHDWPEGATVRVRMGIHTGEPTVGDEGYLGLDVVRAARICATAVGGQVLVSETTRALLGAHESEDFELRDVGERELKDLPRREHLFELVVEGVPGAVGVVSAELVPVPRPESEEAAAGWALAARGPKLAERFRSAADELRGSIEREVEAELRAAGLSARPDLPRPPRPSDVPPVQIPWVHRRATNAELLLAAFVVTLVVGAIVGIIVLILLLAF